MCEFAGDHSAAQDDDGFWNRVEIEDIVAGEERDIRKARNSGDGDLGAGCDEDTVCGEGGSVCEDDGPILSEFSILAEKVEPFRLDLGFPVTCEFTDDFLFALVECGHVD